MNTAIENLNQWGGQFLNLALTMFWQSSLLGLVLLVLDFALRRHLRASVRYALWLVLLVKLVTPPSLALPTSPAWWWSSATRAPLPDPQFQFPNYTVTHDDILSLDSVPFAMPAEATPLPPALTPAALGLLLAGGVSLGLFLWLLRRWHQVVRTGRAAQDTPEFAAMLVDSRQLIKIPARVRVKLTGDAMSPAVCGLFRPVILLPQSLIEKLAPEQLRAVLLHELMHLRRGDVWVNFAQALLQIIYWWHPLVWLANARIRRLREEAVDDAVMIALREDAEIYAPTLLAVAKFAFQRPLVSLGLVGILESRSALRQRIERLINFPTPQQAGLTLVSALGILAFSAVALPMGDAPEPSSTPASPAENTTNAPAITSAKDQQVTDGMVLYEMGKFDEAAAKFHEELTVHPDNAAAHYYLDLIRKAKAGRSGFVSPTANPYAQTGVVYTGPGRQQIVYKLDHIRLAKVDSDGLPLSEVLSNVAAQVRICDPQKTGVNFLITPASPSSDNPATNSATPADLGSVRIKFHLSDVRLADVLDAIVLVADQPIKYSIQDFAVVFSPKSADEPLFMRTFKIDPDTFFQGLDSVISTTFVGTGGVTGRSGGGSTGNNPGAVVSSVNIAPVVSQTPQGQSMGPVSGGASGQNKSTNLVVIKRRTDEMSIRVKNYFNALGVSLSAPKAVFYNDRLGLLFIKATQSDLDTIERAVETLNQTSPRMHIKAPFIEVQQTDSNALGFNWYLGQFGSAMLASGSTSPSLNVPVSAANPLGTFPGSTAASQIPGAATDQLFTGGLQHAGPAVATITGVLTNPNFQTAIHALEQRQRVQYLAESTVSVNGVNDYSANISQAPATEPEVTTTIGREANMFKPYQVNSPSSGSNQLWVAAQSVPAENNPSAATNLIERTFKVNAITFPLSLQQAVEPGPSGEPMGFGDRLHALFARAGVELTAPKSLYYNDTRGLLMVKATPGDLSTVARVLAALYNLEPQLHIKARFIEITGALEKFPTLTNHVAGEMVSGILSASQAQIFRHQLAARRGTINLAEPEVTTSSGRRTQMRSTDIITIVTGRRHEPPLTSISSDQVSNPPPVSIITTNQEFGPIFDVWPWVLADGYTVELNVTATLREFLGYIAPTNSITAGLDHMDSPTNVTAVYSEILEHTLAADWRLYDGQTLLLYDRQPRHSPDKSDRAADPSKPGQFKADREPKHLLVLAVVSIVDPAGNRVHTDNDMSFAQNRVPPSAPPVSPYLPATPSVIVRPANLPRLDDRPFDQEQWRRNMHFGPPPDAP